MSNEPPQPSSVVSEAYKQNFDQIDWEKPYKRAVKAKAGDQTPVKGIPCIRTDKPHVSQNGAVHKDQVRSFNKQCVRGVHYDGSGALVSTSSGAREREARRRGLSFG